MAHLFHASGRRVTCALLYYNITENSFVFLFNVLLERIEYVSYIITVLYLNYQY